MTYQSAVTVVAVAQLDPAGPVDVGHLPRHRIVEPPDARVLAHLDAVPGEPGAQLVAVEPAQRHGRHLTTKPSRWRRKPSTKTFRAYFSPSRSTALVEGADQHHAPEAVDGPRRLAVGEEPVAERRVVVRPCSRTRRAGPRRRGASRRREVVRAEQRAARCNGAGHGSALKRLRRRSGVMKYRRGCGASRWAMPTVRKKWARLVQQPMLTCWQASTSWPVAGSVNEPARPPSRCRDSSTVTRKPRWASRRSAPARPARRRSPRPDSPPELRHVSFDPHSTPQNRPPM